MCLLFAVKACITFELIIFCVSHQEKLRKAKDNRQLLFYKLASVSIVFTIAFWQS